MMRYLATEAGLMLTEPARQQILVPELWIPSDRSVMDLPPMRDPFGKLPKAEAWGIGGGAATSLMAAGSGVSPIDIFGARCQQWCRADRGVLIGSAPFGTGATIQAVTFTGSSATPIDLLITIQTTGARGTATFAVAVNGTSIESGVVTSATHACIGAATGITVNFPTGTYTSGDTYEGVATTWQDQSGFGNDYTAPTANAPYFKAALASLGGGNGLKFRGATTYLTCSSLVLASGNNTAFTLFIEACIAGISNVDLVSCGSTTAGNPLWDLQLINTTPTWTFSKRNDVGTPKTTTGGTPDLVKHYFTLVNDGATQSFYQDGSLVSLSSSGDLNVGVTTCDRMTIGGRLQAALTLSAGVDVAEVWGITGTPTPVELAAAHTYFAQRYP